MESIVLLEERNVGSVQALHLDCEIYHFVGQMQRCLARERWCDVIRPSVYLALAVDNVFFHKDRHYVFKLLSRYFEIVFGHIVFEHDEEQDIVLLKWLFSLDHLASESRPTVFPLTNQLFYGDAQWLLGRWQRECLLPP
jgi:hypothetical protein